MASLKSIDHFHFLVSSQPTKPKKNLSFPLPPSRLFINKNSILDANLFPKNTRRILHLWRVKAVIKEDKDLIAAAESSHRDEDEKERRISEGEVVEKESLLSDILGNSDRLTNAAIVLGAGTLAITKLLFIDHDYWHVSSLFLVIGILFNIQFVGFFCFCHSTHWHILCFGTPLNFLFCFAGYKVTSARNVFV